MKRDFILLFITVLVTVLACSDQKSKSTSAKVKCDSLTANQIEELKAKVSQLPLEPVAENEVAVIETNMGTMELVFFMDKAPEHSKAFKRLVNAGYYDCTKFHRIIPDFVIQGGDILTRDDIEENDGTGNPGYQLNQEFNDTPHDKGILSMARAQDVNSAGSQFFICLSRRGTAALDNNYTVFGKVVEGLDVLDKIAAVPIKANRFGEKSVPTEPVYIKKAYMKTK